jgi:hypothetical protein
MIEGRSAQSRTYTTGRYSALGISTLPRDSMFQRFNTGCLPLRILDLYYGLIVISSVSRVTPRSAA